MEHPQLNVIYPACPFIYDYNKITETYGAASQELDRDNFLLEVASVGVDYFDYVKEFESDSNDTNVTNETNIDDFDTMNHIKISTHRLREMLKYLSDITGTDQINTNYTEIRYYRTDQTMDSSVRLDMSGNVTKQLWLNLHTLAYDCINKSTSLDSEMRAIVSWCIVPIIGNVRPVSTETIIYSDILELDIKNAKSKDEKSRSVSVKNQINNKINEDEESIVDCLSSKGLVNNKILRYSQRNFVKRETEKKEEKKTDVSRQSLSENGKSMVNLSSQFVKPNREQITFTNNTRNNAYNIRSAIMSKYKQYRLKQVPQMSAAHRSVDLRIVNGSEKIAEAHNSELMSRIRFLDRTFSDYRIDDVIISKVNSIFRFTPMTSGRIILDLSEPEYDIPSGLSVYTNNRDAKNKSNSNNIDERKLDPPPFLKDPDLVGDAKPKEKINTKISIVAKRVEQPHKELVKIEENKRNQPYWISRKVATKEEIEAEKVATGDSIGTGITKSNKKIKILSKTQDRINNAKINSRVERDQNSKLRGDIGVMGVPDLAFVTVVRVDSILCLTLNCIKVKNIVK